METFDFETLRRGYEQKDPELLASLYADDSHIHIVDATHPPSKPQVFSGKAQISEFLADLCSREMTHRFGNEAVGADRVAFNIACRYPDGVRVLAATICDIRDGKISREVTVQAWDS